MHKLGEKCNQKVHEILNEKHSNEFLRSTNDMAIYEVMKQQAGALSKKI